MEGSIIRDIATMIKNGINSTKADFKDLIMETDYNDFDLIDHCDLKHKIIIHKHTGFVNTTDVCKYLKNKKKIDTQRSGLISKDSVNNIKEWKSMDSTKLIMKACRDILKHPVSFTLDNTTTSIEYCGTYMHRFVYTHLFELLDPYNAIDILSAIDKYGSDVDRRQLHESIIEANVVKAELADANAELIRMRQLLDRTHRYMHETPPTEICVLRNRGDHIVGKEYAKDSMHAFYDDAIYGSESSDDSEYPPFREDPDEQCSIIIGSDDSHDSEDECDHISDRDDELINSTESDQFI